MPALSFGVLAGAGLVLALAAHAAVAAEPGLIGLLEMPLIYELLERAGTRGPQPAPLRIHREPTETSRVVATLDHRGIARAGGARCVWEGAPACRYREAEYEVPALAVFEVRAPAWYRVAVDPAERQFGWIRSAERFHTLDSLVASEERLTHLTAAWNGRLHEAPGVGPGRLVVPKAKRKAEQPYRALRHTRVGGRLWIEVALLDAVCDGGEERVIATGWVSAKTPAGVPVAWFWSRGC